MTSLRSEAYVLSRSPLTESSWIVCLLTRREGKVRVVAKGARRTKSPFRGALEPLNRVQADISLREGRDLGLLTSADLEESALDLFGRWPEAGILLAVVEVLDRGLAEHSAEEETYRLVGAVLDAMRAGGSPALAWAYFASWFLRLHGVLGRPGRCAHCGAAKKTGHFDAGAGGWICGECTRTLPEQGIDVPSAAREMLGDIFRSSLPGLAARSPSPEALKGLKAVVYLALVAYLGRPLASGDHVGG